MLLEDVKRPPPGLKGTPPIYLQTTPILNRIK
jgi:hypothetical protein